MYNSELIEILKHYGIRNYIINDDKTIDVKGSVYLNNKYLTSLKGSPKEVGGGYYCYNNNLINLIGGPQEVGWNYICHSNQLETLEGCAGDIGGWLDCSNNKLEILDCSSVVNHDIYCWHNAFKDEPEFFGVCGGKIFCNNN